MLINNNAKCSSLCPVSILTRNSKKPIAVNFVPQIKLTNSSICMANSLKRQRFPTPQPDQKLRILKNGWWHSRSKIQIVFQLIVLIQRNSHLNKILCKAKINHGIVTIHITMRFYMGKGDLAQLPSCNPKTEFSFYQHLRQIQQNP